MIEGKLDISCPRCNTAYSIAADMLSGGRRAVKCAVCAHTFVVEASVSSEQTGTSAEETPFGYDPETSPWDTDPADDPVLHEDEQSAGEDTEEAASGTDDDLEKAWVDYDSVSLEDLTFGDDEDEQIEFGGGDEDEAISGDTPIPEPQPPHGASSQEKIDASDDRYTLDGRPADEIEKHIKSSTHSDDIPEELRAVDEEEQEKDEPSVAPDPVELPDLEPDPEESGDVMKPSPLASLAESETKDNKDRFAARKSGTRRSFVKNARQADPEVLESSSGTVYYILMIIIGAAGLASSVYRLGDLQFDPVWSASMIVLGFAGFFLQNLSGIYIAGFFSVLYAFALFSRISFHISQGSYSAVFHIAAIFGLAFIFAITYALLIGRRSGHFVLKESSFQSIVSFILGLLAIVFGYWTYISSGLIAPMGEWHLILANRPLDDFVYYLDVPLSVIAQAAAAAGAIAIGISAHRVRNRQLLLAKLAIVFGIVVIMLLFGTVYLDDFSLDFPV